MTRTRTLAAALAVLSMGSIAPAHANPDCNSAFVRGTKMNAQMLRTAAGYADRIMGGTGFEWQVYHNPHPRSGGDCRWLMYSQIVADMARGPTSMGYVTSVKYRPSDGKWFWEVGSTTGWSMARVDLTSGYVPTPSYAEAWGKDEERGTGQNKPTPALPPG